MAAVDDGDREQVHHHENNGYLRHEDDEIRYSLVVGDVAGDLYDSDGPGEIFPHVHLTGKEHPQPLEVHDDETVRLGEGADQRPAESVADLNLVGHYGRHDPDKAGLFKAGVSRIFLILKLEGYLFVFVLFHAPDQFLIRGHALPIDS